MTVNLIMVKLCQCTYPNDREC